MEYQSFQLENSSTGVKAKLRLAVDRSFSYVVILGSGGLACYLNPAVWKLYNFTCPVGLLIYFCYGYWHSQLPPAEKR